jgi:hypothetical protein
MIEGIGHDAYLGRLGGKVEGEVGRIMRLCNITIIAHIEDVILDHETEHDSTAKG